MGSAQDPFSIILEGRVSNPDGDITAVHVLNLSQERATITDINGFFAIRASLNDTLVFSAIQFKKKTLVVTQGILESTLLYVPLEEVLNELDEVVVMPYNLSGNIDKDLERISTEPVVTASTLGLPNAYVVPPTQAERKLFEATTGAGIIPLNPIINALTGRTKMLKNRIIRNEKYERTQRVRAFFADSLYLKEFGIPTGNIADFMYFCEIDPAFQNVVDTHDWFKIWEYMRKKSMVYRSNNPED